MLKQIEKHGPTEVQTCFLTDDIFSRLAKNPLLITSTRPVVLGRASASWMLS